jgi:putative FmdB family regulatory protein
MPTYEYACRDCGHVFEIVQSMKDDALTVCPECGGSLRKVFAPPAIAFKGSGFYATDHGKKAKGAEKGAGSDKGAGSEKGAEKGAEKRPEGANTGTAAPKGEKGSEKKGEKSPEASRS